MLEVKNEELVLLFCPMHRVLQHKVLDVHETLLQVVIIEQLVFLLLGLGIGSFDVLVISIYISETCLLERRRFPVLVHFRLDSRLVITEVDPLRLDIIPRGVFDLELFLH